MVPMRWAVSSTSSPTSASKASRRRLPGRHHQLWGQRAVRGRGSPRVTRSSTIGCISRAPPNTNTRTAFRAGEFGESAPSGRDWFNAADAGQHRQSQRRHASVSCTCSTRRRYQYAKYGLITNGPLQGTAFDANGNPFPFAYGSNGAPAKNAAGTVNGCFVGFCVGGDNSGGGGHRRVAARFRRTHSSATAGSARASTTTTRSTPRSPGRRSIPAISRIRARSRSGHHVVSAPIHSCPQPPRQACTNAGITSFQFGADQRVPGQHSRRAQRASSIVSSWEPKARLNVLRTEWRYDSYYQRGENTTDIHVSNACR